MPPETVIIVTARDEADRLAATIAGLRRAFGDAPIVVADDGSTDGTVNVAARAGAAVMSPDGRVGKGGAATLGARHARELGGPGAVYVLCDGDLAASAEHLAALEQAVRGGADLAVAVFTRRVGGGFGLAVGFAGWAIRRRCGLRLRAPISGQRALSSRALDAALPFAAGFGMEIGMTIDVARAGCEVVEVELELEHRATARSVSGFRHRGRQLWAFVAVYVARRPSRVASG
jgi:glycosyltransferase involved in cell wall biosynthesis